MAIFCSPRKKIDTGSMEVLLGLQGGPIHHSILAKCFLTNLYFPSRHFLLGKYFSFSRIKEKDRNVQMRKRESYAGI